jgi:glycosyl transferase, family 25
MKIFYINLDKDIKRRDSMERQLASANLNYERISAVYGQNMSKEALEKCYSRRKALRCQCRELRLSEIGCAMSHIHVYRKIVDEKLPYALILEDDVVIPEGFGDVIGSIERLIQADRPEILLLSPASVDLRHSGAMRASGNYKADPFIGGFFASSYIVTRLAALSLLQELYPVSMEADNWKRLNKFKVSDFYVLSPCLIEQDQDTFGSSTTADYRGFANLGEKLIYKSRRLRCVVLDFFQAPWRRKFHPYNNVLKVKK